MHEFPIVESLLAVALQHAEEAGAKKICQLNISIGQMSTVAEDAVRFYWTSVAKDTIAEGATLHFQRVPAAFYCFNCYIEFALDDSADPLCPHCQSAQVQVVAGDDLRLESIDVE